MWCYCRPSYIGSAVLSHLPFALQFGGFEGIWREPLPFHHRLQAARQAQPDPMSLQQLYETSRRDNTADCWWEEEGGNDSLGHRLFFGVSILPPLASLKFSEQTPDPTDGSYTQECGLHACNIALQYPALPHEKAYFKRTTNDALTADGVRREEDWHRLCLGDIGRFISNKRRDDKEPGVGEGERTSKGAKPTTSLKGVKGDDNALCSKVGLLTDLNEERAGAVIAIMLREDEHLLTFKPLREGFWADGDSIVANNRSRRLMTKRDTAERVTKDSIVVFGDEKAYNAAKKQQQDNRDAPIALDDDDELQPPAPAAAAAADHPPPIDMEAEVGDSHAPQHPHPAPHSKQQADRHDDEGMEVEVGGGGDAALAVGIGGGGDAVGGGEARAAAHDMDIDNGHEGRGAQQDDELSLAERLKAKKNNKRKAAEGEERERQEGPPPPKKSRLLEEMADTDSWQAKKGRIDLNGGYRLRRTRVRARRCVDATRALS
ncbi:unnamed protein product [Vitrella brassicaformis CCMP3155]|uniref:Uncharacterized protein n=1 Tax=Vitrella brassicaformis (strain CCMP3155) TaxID=1169540 RepID=A0A0G4ESU0_VITBC|nr:unnamed protein product [Vitrella brassicaformis CCMP3155]|eukprot:CEM01717.1 unnamed protein product [Vitrella brassicaformis CCMP3155]